MKISALLPRADLRLALASATRVVEKRSKIPVLTHAALIGLPGGGVAIRATDLDIQATVTIPGAAADEGFKATLPAHVLLDIEKKAPATEHVAIDAPVYGDTPEDDSPIEERATLDFEGLRAHVACLPPRDFPEIAIDGEIKAQFQLPASELLKALEAVEFAISTEETRYYLNGVYMHVYKDPALWRHLRFVATDGHRMGRHDVADITGDIGDDWGVIVPRKTVEFLMTLCKAKHHAGASVHVWVNSTKARFRIGNVDVITKLVDGSYPDYQRIIPTGNDKVLQIEREAFAKALKAVSCISSERGRAFRLSLTEGEDARLRVNNPDAGTTEMDVPCEYVGAPIEIGFNASYVLDILCAMEGETVMVALSDAGAPAIFKIRDAATLYLQMPMRI